MLYIWFTTIKGIPVPATSPEAIARKKNNRQSVVDNDRELKIESLGGQRIPVVYGVPVENRQERIEVLRDLMFPCRKEPDVKRGYSYVNPGDGQFFRSRANQLKGRSRRLGIACDVTSDYLESIWTGRCAISGVDLTDPDHVPSVDRTDPTKGYIMGNVTWMTLRLNRMKNNATLDELKVLVAYMERYG